MIHHNLSLASERGLGYSKASEYAGRGKEVALVMVERATKRLVRLLNSAMSSAFDGDYARVAEAAGKAGLVAEALRLARDPPPCPTDYYSNVPLGFATPIDYLRAHAPGVFEYIHDLRAFVTEAEADLQTLSLAQGYPITSVAPSQELLDLGITDSLAFTLIALAQHFLP